MTTGLHRVLMSDVTVLRVLLGSIAVLFGMGWFLADSSGQTYTLMLRQASPEIWGTAFIIYGICKFLLATKDAPKAVIWLVVVLGSFLWLFTFMSFVQLPNRDPGPAEFMILVAILSEVWVGSSTLALGRHSKYGRRHDDR